MAEDLTKGDRCTGGLWEPLVIPVEVPVETPDTVNDTVETPKEEPTIDIVIKSYTGDDCIVKDGWCYCNPRGSLDNKRKC